VKEGDYNPTLSNYHAIKNACWKEGKPVPYAALCQVHFHTFYVNHKIEALHAFSFASLSNLDRNSCFLDSEMLRRNFWASQQDRVPGEFLSLCDRAQYCGRSAHCHPHVAESSCCNVRRRRARNRRYGVDQGDLASYWSPEWQDKGGHAVDGGSRRSCGELKGH
jgi:hypothetical protein